MKTKKKYSRPQLTSLGTVAQMTLATVTQIPQDGPIPGRGTS